MKMFMFEKQCRLCITDKDVSSTLNHSDSDNIILLDKLNLLAPDLLQINSSLPIGICTTCIAHLNQAYKFIKTCFRSQEILNKYLKQSQNGLEQNNAIIDMNDIQNELTDEVFHNTLVNDEIESVFIKQENIEYNDCSESIQVNFEDDINEEECNYSIDIQCNRNVKECLSKDIIDINNEIIEEHLNETDINTEVKSFQCKMCKAAFARKGDLKNHIRTHTSGKQSQNGLEQSKNYEFLLNEMKLENNAMIAMNDMKIELADEVFHNTLLNDEIESVFIKQENIIDYNDSSESIQVNFEDDINEKETNVEEECNYSIDIQSNRKNRSKRQTYTGKKTFVCKICGKGCASLSALTSHTRKHTGEKPFQCNTCDKTYAYKGMLIRHIRSHTGEKPYRCKTCKKAYATKISLTIHNRIHTVVGPYPCTMCTQKFKRKGSLTNHIRLHTGERPFQCKMCMKTFIKNKDLIKHIRTHSGENPFQCKFCKEAFKGMSPIMEHIRTSTSCKSGYMVLVTREN